MAAVKIRNTGGAGSAPRRVPRTRQPLPVQHTTDAP